MLRRTLLKTLVASAVAISFSSIALAEFDGPADGPAGAADKTIVVLAADMKNGGVLGVTNGVEEAAEAIGWNVRVLDGAGSIQGRTAAFGQAIACNRMALSSTDSMLLNSKQHWIRWSAQKYPWFPGIQVQK